MESFAPIVVIVLFLGAIILGANALSEASCKNNVQEMGKEYRYDIVNGCRVGLDDGTFVYWKMYKVVNK